MKFRRFQRRVRRQSLFTGRMVRSKSAAVRKNAQLVMKVNGVLSEDSPEKCLNTKTSVDKRMVKQKSRKVKDFQNNKNDNYELRCDEIHRSSAVEAGEKNLVSNNKKNPPEYSRLTRKEKQNFNVMREIRKYQKSVELLIPRAPFARVCKEIFINYAGRDIRIQSKALECLQESAEMYLVQMFEDSYLCALHARRVTLMNKDVRLTRRTGGRRGYYL